MNSLNFPFSRTLKSYILGRKAAQHLKLDGWAFSPDRALMIYNELSNWQVFYNRINLRGKDVLSVGAGEGEDAKFFLELGARKVYAIEADPLCFENLQRNAKRFPIVPICRPFNVTDLNLPVAFAKVDIEGYEESILPFKPPYPCVVEVHGLQLRDKFAAAGWRIEATNKARYHKDCNSYAYWKC